MKGRGLLMQLSRPGLFSVVIGHQDQRGADGERREVRKKHDTEVEVVGHD